MLLREYWQSVKSNHPIAPCRAKSRKSCHARVSQEQGQLGTKDYEAKYTHVSPRHVQHECMRMRRVE